MIRYFTSNNTFYFNDWSDLSRVVIKLEWKRLSFSLSIYLSLSFTHLLPLVYGSYLKLKNVSHIVIKLSVSLTWVFVTLPSKNLNWQLLIKEWNSVTLWFTWKTYFDWVFSEYKKTQQNINNFLWNVNISCYEKKILCINDTNIWMISCKNSGVNSNSH